MLKMSGISTTEAEWELCEQWVRSPISNGSCLVYSVGSRNIYQTEKGIAAAGCEVFMFDCTVNLNQNVAPNLTFYPWCVGDAETELQIGDGKNAKAEGKVFKTLPQILRELGHADRELTVLKMDCEGCEWSALASLGKENPHVLDTLRILLMETHYVSNPTKPLASQVSEQAEASRLLAHFAAYRFHWNPDMSEHRDTNHSVHDQLMTAGVISAYYEFALVNAMLLEAPTQ
jgi:hypothetical protein